jgi:hypothetical protein
MIARTTDNKSNVAEHKALRKSLRRPTWSHNNKEQTQMSLAIIKADAGWFAIFAVPGKPWTTNRLPVLAWRVDACEACEDSPIAEQVTVAGNGVLEGWKPAVQFEDGPVHSCGNTFANATEWLADIQHAAMRDEAEAEAKKSSVVQLVQ